MRDKKNYYKYTEDEINSIKDVSLIEYMKVRGAEIKKLSANEYKMPGYGGLVISDAENTWYCFTASRGGGLVQLLQFLENKTWIEAVDEILGSPKERIVFHDESKSEKSEMPLVLPEKNSSARNVIAYLCTARKLDYDLVIEALQSGNLYQDRKMNCVFVGRDIDGKPRHVHIKGTNPDKPFQKDVEGSDKSFCFSVSGSSNKVYAFESPIDLLSFMSIQRDMGNETKDNYISLNSTSSMRLMQYLSDNPETSEVVLCLDNDTAGQTASSHITEELKDKDISVTTLKPDMKDYNEVLVYMRSNENPLINDEDFEEMEAEM